MNEAIAEGVTQISQVHEAAGLLGAIAAGIVMLLRLYRLPMVQQIMPTLIQWSNLKKWVKLLIVFALAALASVVAALVTGGVSWPVVAGGAIVAGLMALGANEGTEGAAATLAPMVPEGFKRSAAGQITSVLLPMPANLQAPMLKADQRTLLDIARAGGPDDSADVIAKAFLQKNPLLDDAAAGQVPPSDEPSDVLDI